MNGVFKKIAAVALSAGMIAASCVTSFAAPATTVGTTSTNKATIAVGKTLYNPKGKLSAQSFNFKIEAVEAADGRTMKTIAVKDIPMPTAEKATATIPFSTAEVKDKTKVTKGANFGEITYTKPGYYMYKVSEVIPESKVAGVTYDETSYFVCVYVTEKTDANGNTTNDVEVKEITSWHNDKASNTAKPNVTDIAKTVDNNGNAATSVTADDEKVTFGKVNYTKFVNQTASADIIVTKNVQGNLGDRDYDFEFTTTFAGLNPGSTYKCTKTSQASETSDVSITADTAGKATLTYTLKDDENMHIQDLPIGAKYTTTEAASNHIASYKLSGTGAAPVIVSGAKANPAQNAQLACSEETVDVEDGTITEAFTNTRNLTTITGVPGMDYIAYGVAGILVLGIALMIRRRRYSDDLSE